MEKNRKVLKKKEKYIKIYKRNMLNLLQKQERFWRIV